MTPLPKNWSAHVQAVIGAFATLFITILFGLNKPKSFIAMNVAI